MLILWSIYDLTGQLSAAVGAAITEGVHVSAGGPWQWAGTCSCLREHGGASHCCTWHARMTLFLFVATVYLLLVQLLAQFPNNQFLSNFLIIWSGGNLIEGHVIERSKMAARLAKVLSEESQCGVCLDTFCEPRSLPCGHTFCTACLEGVLRQSKRREIECPSCRTKHSTDNSAPKELARKFVLNFKASKFAHALNNLKKACETGSVDAAAVCNNCVEGRTADAWCTDCARCLCHDCVSTHKRLVDYARHTMLPLAEAEVSRLGSARYLGHCAHSSEELLPFHCNSCVQMVCADCALLKHRSHEVVLKEDRAALRREALQSAVRRLSAAQCSLEDRLVSLTVAEERLGGEVDTLVQGAERHIQGYIQGFIRQLSALEVFVKEQYAALGAQRREDLERLNTKTRTALADTCKVCSNTKAFLQEASSARLVVEGPEMEAAVYCCEEDREPQLENFDCFVREQLSHHPPRLPLATLTPIAMEVDGKESLDMTQVSVTVNLADCWLGVSCKFIVEIPHHPLPEYLLNKLCLPLKSHRGLTIRAVREGEEEEALAEVREEGGGRCSMVLTKPGRYTVECSLGDTVVHRTSSFEASRLGGGARVSKDGRVGQVVRYQSTPEEKVLVEWSDDGERTEHSYCAASGFDLEVLPDVYGLSLESHPPWHPSNMQDIDVLPMDFHYLPSTTDEDDEGEEEEEEEDDSEADSEDLFSDPYEVFYES